jgi:hypothetical protein
LRSIWKRKGDLSPEQLASFQERVRDWTSPITGKVRLQETRRRLLQKGIIFNFFQFRPYVQIRDTKDQDSVMVIRSKNGQLRPASRMSPLIRHLWDLWKEDVPLYAFADRSNTVRTDEVLELMTQDTESNPISK